MCAFLKFWGEDREEQDYCLVWSVVGFVVKHSFKWNVCSHWTELLIFLFKDQGFNSMKALHLYLFGNNLCKSMID